MTKAAPIIRRSGARPLLLAVLTVSGLSLSDLSFGFLQKTRPETLTWREYTKGNLAVFYTAEDRSIFPGVLKIVTDGRKTIEEFFGVPYKHPLSVHIFPHRKDLDEHWRRSWEMPEFSSECWMVASGVKNEIDLLSPAVWKQEACEHEPEDEVELQRLLLHEMVHIYHGQFNPHPELAALADIGWFIEGVATYVSGQMDEERLKRAYEAITSGESPHALGNAWSGPYRYAVCGALVLYVDQNYGRSIVTRMLSATSPDELLSLLNISEDELLTKWREYMQERFK